MVDAQVDVAIIGAGSTGLLLAQGLKNAGISSRVFERHAQDFADREWSMSLHWGAEFLSKALPSEIRANLSRIDTNPKHDFSKDPGFMMCNGETAELILMMQAMKPRRVSRRKLRALMSEGIDIEYEKKLESIEIGHGHTVANFADGSSITANVIVGCDGSKSKVREIMVGEGKLSENIPVGFTMFNFPCKYPTDISQRILDIHPTFKIAYHPKEPMMYLMAMLDGSPDEPSEWTHQNLISWAGPPYAADMATQQLRHQRLREVSQVWAEPWHTAASNVTEETRIYADTGSSWDPRTVFAENAGEASWNGHQWHGRVTIAGDAAHTMTPHRGQGLNIALQDASELLSAFTAVFRDKSRDLKTAVATYEQEMVARGGLEVEITGKQSKAAHDWDMLMQSPMFKHGAHKTKE